MKSWMLACVLMSPLAVWAQIYKCPDAQGRLTLQQAPCVGGQEIVVQPARGDDRPAVAPASSNLTNQAQLQQLTNEREQRERWQKRSEAENALQAEQRRCEQEQQAIAQEKRPAQKNLAAAAHEQAVSGRMQAAATMCSTRLRGLEGALNQARQDCDRLGCRQPGT